MTRQTSPILYEEHKIVLLHWQSEFSDKVSLDLMRPLETKIAEATRFKHGPMQLWLPRALEWWRSLPTETQEGLTKEYNDLINGD